MLSATICDRGFRFAKICISSGGNERSGDHETEGSIKKARKIAEKGLINVGIYAIIVGEYTNIFFCG